MGVRNTRKKRKREREKKRRLFRAAQFLRPKRMEDIENRFELTAIQKSGFEGIQSFFGRRRKGKRKKKEKEAAERLKNEKILQIGNLYPDLYPAASSTPVG